ncbi:MAG TPA: hypothetical protein VES79_03195 [Solirubrobacteraceae bacterium]|nr:hypothetical protein [Solirubrobacteraceae bacterium]
MVDSLKPVRPGVYRTSQPILVLGDWRAMIRLHSGRSLLAAPVCLPEDARPAPTSLLPSS